jgi:hypothetical protein
MTIVALKEEGRDEIIFRRCPGPPVEEPISIIFFKTDPI